MFALLFLPGCLAPWGTAIRSTGDTPVRFGDIDVALWWEQTDEEQSDHGYATLLLSSGDMGCGDLEDELWEEFIWKEAGIVVGLTWENEPFDPGEDGQREGENVGYEGTYYQSTNVGKSESDGITTRSFQSVVFSEGTSMSIVDGGAPGTAEVKRHDPDNVAGHIVTDAYEARFAVENCGEIEDELEYDTAY